MKPFTVHLDPEHQRLVDDTAISQGIGRGEALMLLIRLGWVKARHAELDADIDLASVCYSRVPWHVRLWIALEDLPGGGWLVRQFERKDDG